ncbi:MAG: nitrilase [Thiovulaceae bacterium]|nr:nitrilase [Sulfurimonadaceae bacterium]
MKITLVQNAPKLNRTNLETIVAQVLTCKSDVIVFSELSLNGYLLQDKLLEDAFRIDELKSLCDASKETDIVVGAALNLDDEYFNCALYFSRGELLSIHKKVHLPNYGMFEEARYFHSGEKFETFATSYGEVAMLVCEDLWHPNTAAELYTKKPKIVYVLAASPARGFEDDLLTIQEQWYALLKSLALHCDTKVIFVNRVGFEDGLGFWGGSCVLDRNAKILEQFPLFDTITKTVEVKI